MNTTTLPTLCARLLALCLLLATMALHASPLLTTEQRVQKCQNMDKADKDARLSCFDAIPLSTATSTSSVTADSTPATEVAKSEPAAEPAAYRTYLQRKWENEDYDYADFDTYKTNYVLVTKTENLNDIPVSPTHTDTRSNGWNSEDLKFQFSVKTQVGHNLLLIKDLPLVESSRVWLAYTQQSYWNFFSPGISRPFRENDYEPEGILSLGLNEHARELHLPRIVNLGLVHQSNGSSNPLSRSWNRIYLQGGWDLTPHTTLLVRPWWRIPENHNNDDNPDLDKYYGYGDVSIRWEGDTDPKTKTAQSSATLLLRDNLRSDNKGYAQLDLQYKPPCFNKLSAHVSLSTGYGDSLLDYNHATTVLGIGFSVGD